MFQLYFKAFTREKFLSDDGFKEFQSLKDDVVDQVDDVKDKVTEVNDEVNEVNENCRLNWTLALLVTSLCAAASLMYLVEM